MKKINNKGFTLVETLLIILIVLITAFGGFFVWQNISKNKKPKDDSPKTAVTKTQPNKKDPYAGWKTACSDLGGLCMKYPSTWTYSQDNSSPETSISIEDNTFKNPADNFIVIYSPQYRIAGDGLEQTIKVVDVVSTKAAGLSVFSIITERNDDFDSTGKKFIAYVFIEVDSLRAMNDAKTQYVKGANFVAYERNLHRFNNPKKPTQYGNQFMQLQEQFSTYQSAQDWLNSPNVKTAGLIMQSTSYKQ